MGCGLTLLAVLLAQAAPAGADVTAATVGGQSVSGRLAGIDETSVRIATSAGPKAIPLRDLWTIDLAAPGDIMTETGAVVVTLRQPAGGALAVTRLAIADGRITGQSSLLGEFSMDLSLAAAIYFTPAGRTPGYCRDKHRELSLPKARKDFLVVVDDKGKWVPIPGVLKGISGAKVAFTVGDRDRSVDISGLRLIQLAGISAAKPAARGVLVGRDGTRAPFARIVLTGAKLSVSGPRLTAAGVKLSDVAAIRFGSDRVVYLSELVPAKVEQAGLFDVTFPFRRDRSAAGKPIRLGGKAYARGVGMHSRCELTYDLDGKYASLIAVAGIDQAGGSRGNATLEILGDGKPRIKTLILTGGDKPQPVHCGLAGVKTLTIRVDFGPDKVDVGDHVSLGAARLIKP